MEKILILVLGLVYAFWHFSVQNIEVVQSSSHSVNVESTSAIEEPSVSHRTTELSQEHVHRVIKRVGEEMGWIMTDFKSNTIIAEKINENETVAVTVTFHGSTFDVSPENSELNSAIKRALKI